MFDREMAVAPVIQGLIRPLPVGVYHCSLGNAAFDNRYEGILLLLLLKYSPPSGVFRTV